MLEEGECLDLGMRLFVGVARGSDEPPKLVHLAYKPPAAAPSAPPPRKVRRRALACEPGPAAPLPTTSARLPSVCAVTAASAHASNRGPQIALVGKGLTFDSGGYNLKVGRGRRNLHCGGPARRQSRAASPACEEVPAQQDMHALQTRDLSRTPYISLHDTMYHIHTSLYVTYTHRL